jgi:hypothetical protein
MDETDAPHRSPKIQTHELTDTQRILNQLDTITATLATIHNDLAFSMHRLDEVERHLNIFTVTPKKAAALNEAAKAESAMDTDTVYEPEVDTSESRVIEQEKHIAILHAETEELRKHNKDTIEKLNIALSAVSKLQHRVLDDTHPAHIIPIPQLNIPGAVITLDDGTEVPAPELYFK